MKCVECEHFQIKYEPIKDSSAIWDPGRAVCKKYNLTVDFTSHRRLNRLDCVEDDEVTFAQVRGDNNG